MELTSRGDARGQDKQIYEILKRTLDLAIALALLVILSPLWLLIAIIIRLSSPGPALFTGLVAGKGGRIFKYYKFRTMYTDRDDREHRQFIHAFVTQNKPYSVEVDKEGNLKPIFKIVGDRRVTPLGRILRKTGTDEIPQLINVIKGEMSIVGPRPPVIYEYELYNERQKQRLAVRPGITGLYQITSRSVAPFEQMLQIDLEYIQKQSLWLDVKIMLKTIPVMALGKGA